MRWLSSSLTQLGWLDITKYAMVVLLSMISLQVRASDLSNSLDHYKNPVGLSFGSTIRVTDEMLRELFGNTFDICQPMILTLVLQLPQLGHRKPAFEKEFTLPETPTIKSGRSIRECIIFLDAIIDAGDYQMYLAPKKRPNNSNSLNVTARPYDNPRSIRHANITGPASITEPKKYKFQVSIKEKFAESFKLSGLALRMQLVRELGEKLEGENESLVLYGARCFFKLKTIKAKNNDTLEYVPQLEISDEMLEKLNNRLVQITAYGLSREQHTKYSDAKSKDENAVISGALLLGVSAPIRISNVKKVGDFSKHNFPTLQSVDLTQEKQIVSLSGKVRDTNTFPNGSNVLKYNQTSPCKTIVSIPPFLDVSNLNGKIFKHGDQGKTNLFFVPKEAKQYQVVCQKPSDKTMLAIYKKEDIYTTSKEVTLGITYDAFPGGNYGMRVDFFDDEGGIVNRVAELNPLLRVKIGNVCSPLAGTMVCPEQLEIIFEVPITEVFELWRYLSYTFTIIIQDVVSTNFSNEPRPFVVCQSKDILEEYVCTVKDPSIVTPGMERKSVTLKVENCDLLANGWNNVAVLVRAKRELRKSAEDVIIGLSPRFNFCCPHKSSKPKFLLFGGLEPKESDCLCKKVEHPHSPTFIQYSETIKFENIQGHYAVHQCLSLTPNHHDVLRKQVSLQVKQNKRKEINNQNSKNLDDSGNSCLLYPEWHKKVKIHDFADINDEFNLRIIFEWNVLPKVIPHIEFQTIGDDFEYGKVYGDDPNQEPYDGFILLPNQGQQGVDFISRSSYNPVSYNTGTNYYNNNK